jgi:Flp pilus assembly protein TadG
MMSKFTAAHRKPIANTSSTASVAAIASVPEPAYRPAPAMGVDADAGERMGSFSRRRLRQRGQAMVEFALGLPLLLTLITGLVMFGVAFNNELTLTYATDAAAQLLSISRGQTTDPCQTASQAVYSAAPQLNQSNLAFTIVLNGTSVTTNSTQPSCSGSQQYLVQSQPARVTATYPCNLTILGVNFAPNCTLTAQSTVLIQ